MTHFWVDIDIDVCFGLLSWWKIQTRPIIRFLTEAVRFSFFICWYLIESMMPCIWTRCPGPLAEKQAHNIKDPAVYLTVGMGVLFYPCLHQSHLVGLLPESSFLVSSDHRSQSHLKFQSCLTTEFAGDVFGWVGSFFFKPIWNNMWWCRGCLIFFFLGGGGGGLSDPRTQLISAILQLWSLKSLWPLKLSSSPCIRTI